MGIADDVKRLSEDIATSHDARIKTIGTIVKETQASAKNTHTMLKGFNAEHKEMSAAQAKDLAGFAADLTKKVGNLLKGFQAKHKEMSAGQARDLAKFMADLTKNVGNLLKGFQKEHKDMAAALKASLRKNTSDIETYVKNKLREFSDAHAEMSDELKKDLAKYVADIVNGTRELLGAFHDEREKMADHWQAMAAVMAKKRGVGPVEVEAKSEVKTVEEAVGKPAAGKAGKGKIKGNGKKK